jgi:O-antigen ligase
MAAKSPLSLQDALEHVILGLILLLLSGAFVMQLSGTDPSVPVNPASSDSLQGSLVMQSLLASSYAFTLVVLARTAGATSMLIRSWPVFLLPGLAVISTAWSVDPVLTFRKSIALIGENLFGVVLAARLPFAHLMRLVIRAMTFGLLASCVWIFVFPTIAVHQITDVWPYEGVHSGAWRGVWGHKTALGHVAALTLGFLCLYGRYAFAQWQVRAGAIGLALICLISSRSGGGFVVGACVSLSLVGLWALGSLPLTHRLTVLVSLISVVILVALLSDTIVALVLGVLGKESDLTGRLPFWDAITREAANIPIYGYGYVAGFARYFGPLIAEMTNERLVNAHNGYLEVFIAFGYVGLMICGIMLVWFWARATQLVLVTSAEKAAENAFPLSIVICVLLSNMVENMMTATSELQVILLAVAGGVIARNCRQSRLSRQPNSYINAGASTP